MSKELDIVLEKVYGHTDLSQIVREDTHTSLYKIDEMKSSWDDMFGAIPDIATKAYKKYSNYAKKQSAKTSQSDDNDRFKDIPRTITRTPGSPEAKQAADQLVKDKAKPNVGLPTSDLPDTRDPRGDKAPNMDKAKEVAAKTGRTRNNSDGTAAQGGDKYEPETPKSNTKPAEAPKSAFKQAWEKARAAAEKQGNAATGTFKFTNKKGETKTYQTNDAPGTGAEKFVTAKHQQDTGVTGSSKDSSKEPETPKNDTGVTVNPNVSNPASDDTSKKTTDQKATPLKESFVMVGSNRYRIV